MLKSKHIIFIFVPALIFVLIVLFIRIVQYEPLFPKVEKEKDKSAQEGLAIPIFSDDPVIGNKKSPLTIIAFEDFACPACRQQDSFLEEIIKTNPEKIKVIWKSIPVTRFPYPSETALKYGYCANLQSKFSEFKAYAFTNSDNLSEATLNIISKEIKLDEKILVSCLESPDVELYIEKNRQIGILLNIQSVPTFFIDNQQITTPTSIDQWKSTLNI